MDVTSNLSLPFIIAAQAEKHVTHNEALRALDAVVQLMVLDKDLNTPPGSPADGARYIVASSPSGAWTGQAAKIAAYQDGAWAFYAPREGWLAWAADEDTLYVWTGAAWAGFTGGGGGGLSDVVDDATPQLGGGLDANGFSIGFDDATGITDDAGNEQVTFHKTASAANQVGITNAAAGNAPRIAAEGADTNIDLTLAGKGSGHPKTALFGINATADTTTRFVVAAAASLFDHAGNGHQHKVNKNAAGDTASLLFQTGSSGRAEMGTAGDDNFHFKVSADGSTWKEAIVIDRSTGAASFPLTPKREFLTANRTYYVRTDGSDANTGLVDSSGGAFLTIQKALDTVAGLDCSTFDVTLQIRNGTYTGANVIKGFLGSGSLIILGDETTPANVVISVTGNHCFQRSAPSSGIVHVRGMKLQTTTAGRCLYALGPTTIFFQNINFGSCTDEHINAQNNALIQATGNYSITGGALFHASGERGGMAETRSISVTLTGTPAFSQAFAQSVAGGRVRATAVTYSGAATGPRYSAVSNGVIETAGGGANYFPGNAAGSAATGGQYV